MLIVIKGLTNYILENIKNEIKFHLLKEISSLARSLDFLKKEEGKLNDDYYCKCVYSGQGEKASNMYHKLSSFFTLPHTPARNSMFALLSSLKGIIILHIIIVTINIVAHRKEEHFRMNYRTVRLNFLNLKSFCVATPRYDQ